MQNIHDIIEIKRGLHRVCERNLVDVIAELDKCEDNNKKEIKKLLEIIISDFFALRNTCSSNEDFKKKYAEQFNEEVRDFSKEIAENRDDSLSDFAKAIQNVYNYKDKK